MFEPINEDQLSKQSLLTATVHVHLSQASFKLFFNTLQLKGAAFSGCLEVRKSIILRVYLCKEYMICS